MAGPEIKTCVLWCVPNHKNNTSYGKKERWEGDKKVLNSWED